jgi:hypothetical protein
MGVVKDMLACTDLLEEGGSSQTWHTLLIVCLSTEGLNQIIAQNN